MVFPFKDRDTWWLFGSSLAPVCSLTEFGRGGASSSSRMDQCWINNIVHVIGKGLIPQDKFPNTGDKISRFSSQLAEDVGKRALL